MYRTEFLNRLLESRGYQTYLEIGVEDGHCLAAVHAPFKVGVDPQAAIDQPRLAGALIHRSTSDDFFGRLHAPGFFDLVFIDGLHEHEQVHRDVIHSLDCLSPRGTIVLHDCNPTSEAMQRVPQTQGEWTGDCWKAIARLRMTREDLLVSVVDTDYGLGVVRRGIATPLVFPKPWQGLTWIDLERHRELLLGLVPSIEVERFLAPAAVP